MTQKIIISIVVVACVAGAAFYFLKPKTSLPSYRIDEDKKYFLSKYILQKKDPDENKKYLETFYSPETNPVPEIQDMMPSEFWLCIKSERIRMGELGDLFFKARWVNFEESRAEVLTLWKNKEAHQKYYDKCNNDEFFEKIKETSFHSHMESEELSGPEAKALLKKITDNPDKGKVDNLYVNLATLNESADAKKKEENEEKTPSDPKNTEGVKKSEKEEPSKDSSQ